MKFLVVLFATVALASAGKLSQKIDLSRSSRSAASMIVDAIESIQAQMPCGFEKFGIPPLAPLKIAHKEINIDGEAVKAQGSVDNALVIGLNEFTIPEMKVNAILSKISFQLDWSSIKIQSLYDLVALLKSYGFTVNLKGAGDMSMAINDIAIQGTIKYSLGLISNQIKLKELKVVVNVGDVECDIEGILGTGLFNRKMNEFIEEFIELAVNDNQDLITNTIEELILPPVNNAVDGMSLTDLISAVGGGDGAEPTVCIPPTN